jgi:tRNA 2-thiouridine synthesizing protein A
MPLLMAKRALMTSQTGDLVRVFASDPGSWRDFHAYAKLAEEQLKAERVGEQEFVYEFTKK